MTRQGPGRSAAGPRVVSGSPGGPMNPIATESQQRYTPAVSILPSSSRENAAAIPGPAEDSVPLCDLRPGERGRLRSVRLVGEAADHVRALGLHEACDLRLCRSAGMCIVQVIGGGGSGCRIALDRELARDVLVTRITHEGRSIGSA